MLLPFALGIAFYGEPLTASKVLCCALIAGAVLLTIEKGERKSGGLRYCFGAFFFNGMSGVLSKIHQSDASQATDSYSFMALANLGNVLLCLALLLAVCKTHPQLKRAGTAIRQRLRRMLRHRQSILPHCAYGTARVGAISLSSRAASSSARPSLVCSKSLRPSRRNLAAAGVAFLASVLIAL